jgi:energy-coupling factor transporter ATP-binding protein EcfA2
MDPALAPYSSGPSIAPPVLAGREPVLAQARLLLARLKQSRTERGLLITGLRGSGKSVLLQALAQLAQAEGGQALRLSVLPGQTLKLALDQALARPSSATLILADDCEAYSADELALLVQTQEELLQGSTGQSLVLAGLPFQAQLDDAHFALAARAFQAFELGALDAAASKAAALAPGADWEPQALPELHRLSQGWPALLQAWAYQAWRAAPGPLLDRAALKAAAPAVLPHLDARFYGPGFERLSPRERAYLRTMAHLGPGPHRSGDIADSMDAKITSLGPLRGRLMKAGWVYCTGHGQLGFDAPGMDDFIRRVMPGFR